MRRFKNEQIKEKVTELEKKKRLRIKSGRAKFTMFRPRIRSRHPSHSSLRKDILPLLPFRSIVRFGSSTDTIDTITNGGARIECNTIKAIQNSANKLKMKQCFEDNGITTSDWCTASCKEDLAVNLIDDDNVIRWPIVAKHKFGSRGRGNTLINNEEELDKWMKGKTMSNYIFEKFYNYNREYRLHVTEEGCFYTCRKMLKTETPEKDRWFRNDSNSVWIVEGNEQFDKPTNWKEIEKQCVKALKAVGLDVGACDVRVQSKCKSSGEARKEPNFVIIEINSAPSFGDTTLDKYIVEIPKILRRKWKQ